jgi:hypothetical protein
LNRAAIVTLVARERPSILIEPPAGNPTITAFEMKNVLPISVLLIAFALPGCAWTKRHTPGHHHAGAAKSGSATAHSKTIVTADNTPDAKVLSVNTVGRFVVLNFPDGHMPKMEQHLFLYHNGLKTAEVQVVGPQQDTSIVADILTGNARAGDTVRDE